MKLVSILFLTVTFTVDAVQDYISFSPQFQTSGSRVISSENSVYLPPESSTPIPFFPIKNSNKLASPYLTSSGMKDHIPFSTPFPFFISSSILPPIVRNDEEEDEDDNRRPSPMPQFLINKVNPTLRNKINVTESIQGNQKKEKIDRPLIPQKMNMHQPIDRIDMKLLNQFTMNNGPTTPYTMMHTPTARSMIIPSDTHIDQYNPENYQNYMNVQVPKFYITPTTETAIPILRLSNEMDLDGSFSYEALGADQTHYVQHSRFENFGSDNQEQVVEGSYSYVGDNGQTYTVNYTADSNGFRASGDHLPVAPPIPEIIQRSIQYNLAKEARMPSEGKYEEKETEPMGNEKLNLFSHSTQNLFTGRTPESFSFGFPRYNMQNNLIPSASTQTPIKTNIEFMQDYMKDKPSASISPQVTFLASQGAHSPSFNTAEQTISRYNPMDKPAMLHLINYEAPAKDSDQEGNKALWRWQYGLNTESSHIPEKNTISRSAGEDDDIMINFIDMTPDQYANEISSQLVSNQKNSDDSTKNELYEAKNKNRIINQSYNFIPTSNEKEQKSATETIITPTHYDNWHKSFDHINIKNNQKNKEVAYPLQPEVSTAAFISKIITQNEIVPPTQIVTQSYDYDNRFYEPKRIKPLNTNDTSISEINKLNLNNNYKAYYESPTTQQQYIVTSEATPFRLTNVQTPQNKNGFTPLLDVQEDYSHDNPANSESVADNIYKENVFLKNLFSQNSNENVNDSILKDVNKNDYHRKSDIQIGEDNVPKFKPLHPYHEMKSLRSKPIDIANILSYISSKNQFESSKVRPKFKQSLNNVEDRDEPRLTPSQRYQYLNQSGNISDYNINNYRNHERQDGLRGIIRNYKTLQRNNGDFHKDNDRTKKVFPSPQELNLPPLGRAGPSMKSYLPPTYA